MMLFFAAFVAGLAAAQTPGEPVTIVSQRLPAPSDTSVNGLAARKVLQAFLQENPDIEVAPFLMPAVGGPQVGGAGQDAAALMGVASGQPAHLMYVNFRRSSSYISHGFLEPLEVLLARLHSADPLTRQADERGRWLADPSDAEVAEALAALKSRTLDRIWQVVYRQPEAGSRGVPAGKHVWALPFESLVRALLYRRDLFSEAGLDPDQPPATWDELVDYARRINSLPNKVGIMLSGGNTVSWSVYSFMVSNGVRYVALEDGQWRAVFNTPAAAESIYYLLQLAFESYEHEGQTLSGAGLVFTGSATDASMRWANGQIGMRFDYLQEDLLTRMNPEQVGLAPVPVPPGGEPAGELNARMLGIFAGASPSQKLAAMRYLWFITGQQAQALRVRVMVDHGYGPFVNPRLLEQFGYTDVLQHVPARWRDVFEQAVAHGVPEPYGQNTQFLYERVSEPINWAFQNAEDLLRLPEDEALSAIREQLDLAAARVDRYMLGRLSEQEWTRRRWVGGVVLAGIFLLFAGCIVTVWRSFSRAERLMGDRPRLRRFIPAYLMLAPAVAVVVLWQYGPMMMGLPLALFDYELVAQSQFVGIDNFATVLYDTRFWASLGRTFYYVLLVVGLGFWPPILVAILLDEIPTDTAKYVFRTIFYLPAIVSGVIMVFLWVQLYQPNEEGFLNQVLMSVNHLGPVGGTLVKWLLLGAWLSLIVLLLAMFVKLRELTWPARLPILLFALALLGVTIWPLIQGYLGPNPLEAQALMTEGIDPATRRGWAGLMHVLGELVGRWDLAPLGWHTNPSMAMLCVVIPGIWAHAGPGCIIYLAALKTVPDELIEAATIDGAGIIQKLAYITLPRIKFLILIQLVGAIVAAFKGGTNFVLAMTGGGPQTETGGATKVLGMDIFERTFMELEYGVGAAMALLLGALVVGLTAYQLKRISRAEFRTADTTEQTLTALPQTAPAGNR